MMKDSTLTLLLYIIGLGIHIVNGGNGYRQSDKKWQNKLKGDFGDVAGPPDIWNPSLQENFSPKQMPTQIPLPKLDTQVVPPNQPSKLKNNQFDNRQGTPAMVNSPVISKTPIQVSEDRLYSNPVKTKTKKTYGSALTSRIANKLKPKPQTHGKTPEAKPAWSNTPSIPSQSKDAIPIQPHPDFSSVKFPDFIDNIGKHTNTIRDKQRKPQPVFSIHSGTIQKQPPASFRITQKEISNQLPEKNSFDEKPGFELSEKDLIDRILSGGSSLSSPFTLNTSPQILIQSQDSSKTHKNIDSQKMKVPLKSLSTENFQGMLPLSHGELQKPVKAGIKLQNPVKNKASLRNSKTQNKEIAETGPSKTKGKQRKSVLRQITNQPLPRNLNLRGNNQKQIKFSPKELRNEQQTIMKHKDLSVSSPKSDQAIKNSIRKETGKHITVRRNKQQGINTEQSMLPRQRKIGRHRPEIAKSNIKPESIGRPPSHSIGKPKMGLSPNLGRKEEMRTPPKESIKPIKPITKQTPVLTKEKSRTQTNVENIPRKVPSAPKPDSIIDIKVKKQTENRIPVKGNRQRRPTRLSKQKSNPCRNTRGRNARRRGRRPGRRTCRRHRPATSSNSKPKSTRPPSSHSTRRPNTDRPSSVGVKQMPTEQLNKAFAEQPIVLANEKPITPLRDVDAPPNLSSLFVPPSDHSVDRKNEKQTHQPVPVRRNDRKGDRSIRPSSNTGRMTNQNVRVRDGRQKTIKRRPASSKSNKRSGSTGPSLSHSTNGPVSDRRAKPVSDQAIKSVRTLLRPPPVNVNTVSLEKVVDPSSVKTIPNAAPMQSSTNVLQNEEARQDPGIQNKIPKHLQPILVSSPVDSKINSQTIQKNAGKVKPQVEGFRNIPQKPVPAASGFVVLPDGGLAIPSQNVVPDRATIDRMMKGNFQFIEPPTQMPKAVPKPNTANLPQPPAQTLAFARQGTATSTRQRIQTSKQTAPREKETSASTKQQVQTPNVKVSEAGVFSKREDKYEALRSFRG